MHSEVICSLRGMLLALTGTIKRVFEMCVHPKEMEHSFAFFAAADLAQKEMHIYDISTLK